ncbi:hypothetical protein V9K67_06695 [Paraflavisolibacter sp. H34]|uniref:hypothetical protein n=1 Tax=Huijunlia imazamoxiresistens TaxID=3127457 RepID=UPI00301892B0
MHLPACIRSLFALALTACGGTAFAQTMSTPYSVYGIGDIDPRSYNHTTGMASTGLALKTGLFTSGNNPASATGLDKSFFMLEANGTFRGVTYSGNPISTENSTNRDFTIKRLGLTTKVTNFWASGIGFRQYSSVNYKFQNTKPVEGSSQNYTIDYNGDGGLNHFFWNNAFALGKHLSLGVTSSLVAGAINQTETITDASGATIDSKRRDYYRGLRLDYGLLYTASISKGWNASVGGRYAYKTALQSERSLSVTDNSTTLVSEEVVRNSTYNLPQSYGAGLALGRKAGTTTFSADYTHEDWSSLQQRGTGWKLVNSDRYSVGAEFASFRKGWDKNAQKKAFQLGAFYNSSYLQVSNQPIRDYGVTAGLSRSLRNGLLYTVSAEAGTRGTIQSGLIKENYVQLSLSLSFRDFLYSKGHRFN